MSNLSQFDHEIEELHASLNQADALLTVATLIDFTELTPNTALHYLWATSNVISNAKSFCEKLLMTGKLS
jgi:hypothetical protein